MVYFGEVFQDDLLDAIDEELLSGVSAISLALPVEGQKRLFNDIERYVENRAEYPYRSLGKFCFPLRRISDLIRRG